MIQDDRAGQVHTPWGRVVAEDVQALSTVDSEFEVLCASATAEDSSRSAAVSERFNELSITGNSQNRRTTPSLSVVIPTLNEAANLPHVLTRLPVEVDEVVIVDGHSVDDTVAVALALRPDARILLQDGRGKGNALACGFEAARGEIIVMLDADGSTDPQEIPDFIRPLLEGADFVKGSRALPGGGSHDLTRLRSAGNRGLTTAVNILYGTRYTDLCYGYNAFWRRSLEHISVTCDGFEVETLLGIQVARAGLDVREVPSMEHERINGESNLNAVRDGLRVLRTILRERVRRRPRTKLVASDPLAALGEMISASEIRS